MEQTLILPKYETFTPPQIEIQRMYWQDDDIWGIMRMYPSSIKDGFNILKESINHFFSKGYSKESQSRYRFTESFLIEFCHLISMNTGLEKSFVQAGGASYEFGIKWCQWKILGHYQKYLQIPRNDTGLYYFFNRDCKKGKLKHYKIHCWRDLLEQSLQPHTYYNRERRKFKETAGLERANIYLNQQFQKSGKIPYSYDTGNKLIANAIRHKYWKKFNIFTWGDLLFETFGLIKGTINLWKEGGGLSYAISKVQEYYKVQGKLPSKHLPLFSSINYKITQKYWISENIQNWEDLTFIASNFVGSPKRKKWRGKQGLDRAIHELKNYYKEIQKLPVAAKFSSIEAAISKNYWKDYGICSWNDLLHHIFGKVNVSKKIWTGKKGFIHAVKVLLKASKNPNQRAKLKARQFPSIKSSISRKYWIEFGVESWKDMMDYILDKI
ncbi:hypothetical protein WKT22_04337 [Candidatus Lokiarchaeum ossiferum]